MIRECSVLFPFLIVCVCVCVCSYCDTQREQGWVRVCNTPQQQSPLHHRTGRGVRNVNTSSSSHGLLHEKKPFRDTLRTHFSSQSLPVQAILPRNMIGTERYIGPARFDRSCVMQVFCVCTTNTTYWYSICLYLLRSGLRSAWSNTDTSTILQYLQNNNIVLLF